MPRHTVDVAVRRTHLVLAALIVALALARVGLRRLVGRRAGADELHDGRAGELRRRLGAVRARAEDDDAAHATSRSRSAPSGGFDTPATARELSVRPLRRSPSCSRASAPSFGGKVKGDLGDPDDWKLEAIRDGDVGLRPLPAHGRRSSRPGRRGSRATRRTFPGRTPGRLSQFGSFAGTDPRDVFGMLKAVSGSIEAVGTEEIRGVETSHYMATVDVAKLEQLVPAEQRQSLGRLDEAAKAGRADRAFRSRSGSTPTSRCASSRSTSTRSSRGPRRP